MFCAPATQEQNTVREDESEGEQERERSGHWAPPPFCVDLGATVQSPTPWHGGHTWARA